MRPHPVLVVEDSQEILHFLIQALRLLDCLPIPARSGVEAVDVFSAYSRVIDVALIDQRLPTLDGLATLQALRRVKPTLRCCIMGGTVTEDQESILATGAVCVLPKPFSLEKLADCMRLLRGQEREES